VIQAVPNYTALTLLKTNEWRARLFSAVDWIQVMITARVALGVLLTMSLCFYHEGKGFIDESDID
jgi:hypothetical protein